MIENSFLSSFLDWGIKTLVALKIRRKQIAYWKALKLAKWIIKKSKITVRKCNRLCTVRKTFFVNSGKIELTTIFKRNWVAAKSIWTGNFSTYQRTNKIKGNQWVTLANHKLNEKLNDKIKRILKPLNSALI